MKVFNTIQIKGETDKILENILNSKNQVDFNKVQEMPKELQVIGDINSEQNLALDIMPLYETNQIDKLQEIASKLLNKQIEKKYVMFYFQPIYAKAQKIDQEAFKEKRCENLVLALIEKYSAKDMYNWAEKNWSVKENAQNTQIDGDTIRFETEDNPPLKYYKKLREKLNDQNIDFQIKATYMQKGSLIAQEEILIEKERLVSRPRIYVPKK